MRQNSSANLEIQRLEDRICMSVNAMLTDAGSLLVSGHADGQVDIVGVDLQTFDVFDDGILVDTISGVNRHILVHLDHPVDSLPPADDAVNIQLNDQVIHKVFAHLGHGDNSFQIDGNETIDRITYRGGHGDDSLRVNVAVDQAIQVIGRGGADTLGVNDNARRIYFNGGHGDDTVALSENVETNLVSAAMGPGDNTFGSQATVNSLLRVRGGAATDDVHINGEVGGTLIVNMGHGDNQLKLAATVAGSAFIRGGHGVDVVNVSETASVGHHAGIVLGHGNNEFNLRGSFGSLFALAGSGNDSFHLASSSRVQHHSGVIMGHGNNEMHFNGRYGGNIHIWGGAGDDHVVIGEAALVNGSVGALLGNGDNRFLHAGLINGDLTVLSKNPDDVFVVTGIVNGSTYLNPGGQGP